MTDAQPHPNRWLALVVLCVGMLMIVLDSTIVNVALPSIQDDLGFSQSSLAWVVNAYLIAFGGLLLLAGRIGDLVGPRRVFLLGLGIFTVASLACGIAQSQEVLIVARFVQGVGGALTSAVILGMIVTLFPEPREQAKAIGVYAFVASAGASIGLLAGGALTQLINWHWIFFVNLPIGVATALFALRLVGGGAGIGWRRGADVLGAALVTAALMLLVYTIVEAGERGWGSLETLGFGAVSAALLGAFFARQARATDPLMPLGVFRSRNVSGANVVQMLMVAGLFGMFFLGVLYLQQLLGYDAIQTGLAFLPVAVLIGALSLFVTPRLNMRIGERATLLPGLAFVAAGLALVRRRAAGRRLRHRRAAGRRPARHRRGAVVPVAGDARDEGRRAGRGGARIRPDQHVAAGRRRARPRRAGDAVGDAHRHAARRRRRGGAGGPRRLPPRVLGRGGLRRRGDRGRGIRPATGAASGARTRPRSRGRAAGDSGARRGRLTGRPPTGGLGPKPAS